MQIQLRLLILVITVTLSSLCASSVWARGGGGQHVEVGRRHVEKAPRETGVDPTSRPTQLNAGDRIEPTSEDRSAIHKRHRQRCRDSARRGIRGGCYRDGDEWYEDVTPGGDSNASAPPAARQDSSANPPVPRASKAKPDDFNVTPTSNDALKNELIAARKNWIAKKKIADDASAAHARAEYQAMQDGTKVDPALTERQRLAREEAARAHQAMNPLVERARSAGFAPQTLKLYEESSTGY
jgi:hypothetical protein